jgi:hypothetical protein
MLLLKQGDHDAAAAASPKCWTASWSLSVPIPSESRTTSTPGPSSISYHGSDTPVASLASYKPARLLQTTVSRACETKVVIVCLLDNVLIITIHLTQACCLSLQAGLTGKA